MGVLAIWRYPVKAMLGELLETVEIGPAGLAGDRAWVVVDDEDGARIASKRGPTDPRLRACRAQLRSDGLRITLPDGTALTGSAIDAGLSELLERPVRLERFAGPAEGRFGEPAAFHDFAPVHLLTTSTLARMRAAAPGSDWDPRRLRANLLLDDGAPSTPREPFAEDALLGRSLRAAGDGVALAVGFPTPRCVVPTRATQDLPHDPGVLRAIVAEHRVEIPGVGSYGCLGAYAEVARPGHLAVGDRLTAA